MRYLICGFLFFSILSVIGCSGLSVKSADRRSPGTQLEDETIESKSMAIIKEKFKGTAQVSVSSYNRFALITGEAVNDETKLAIERIVYSVLNVKNFADEVIIGPLANASSQRNDTNITRDIYSALNKKPLTSGVVKIVTSNGVVYLLGLVTHSDSAITSEYASTSPGVKKVVKVFEYID